MFPHCYWSSSNWPLLSPHFLLPPLSNILSTRCAHQECLIVVSADPERCTGIKDIVLSHKLMESNIRCVQCTIRLWDEEMQQVCMYILFGTFVKPCIHMVDFYKDGHWLCSPISYRTSSHDWMDFVNQNWLCVGSVSALRKGGMCSLHKMGWSGTS